MRKTFSCPLLSHIWIHIVTKFTTCDPKIFFAVVESTLISSRIETIARLGAWLCGYKSMQATTFEDPGTSTKVSGATNEVSAEKFQFEWGVLYLYMYLSPFSNRLSVPWSVILLRRRRGGHHCRPRAAVVILQFPHLGALGDLHGGEEVVPVRVLHHLHHLTTNSKK